MTQVYMNIWKLAEGLILEGHGGKDTAEKVYGSGVSWGFLERWGGAGIYRTCKPC